MYLAIHAVKGWPQYTISESYYDQETECLRSRALFSLGAEPDRFIVYPGRNSFYIDEQVTDRLESLGTEFDLCELEELFWPFIRKEVRDKLEAVHCRDLRRKVKARTEAMPGQGRVHIIDKRRLYYLRYGEDVRRRAGRLAGKYYRVLHGKSRDELEQYFLGLEKMLTPAEYLSYTYVIFDLQRHFPTPLAETMPFALDADELAECFIKDLCRLHDDYDFWAGFDRSERLSGYLVRYVVMFFDHEFSRPTTWEEFIRGFMDSRRHYQPPPGQSSMGRKEAGGIFGLSDEELAGLSKREITRLFREKAHELHPDKGGDSDAFIRLTQAYEALLQGRK